MLSAGVVDPVGTSEVGLQVAGQLGIGGESLLAELALEFLHVNKLYVVSEGFRHDQTVRTLSKVRAGTVTGLVMNRQLCSSSEQLEASFTLNGFSGYISNILGVFIISITQIVILRSAPFVFSVTVVLEEFH